MTVEYHQRFLVSDSIGESVGADQEADEMEKNDNLDPIEISEMENGGLEPDDDPTDDSSDTDGGSDGGEVSLVKFLNFYHFLTFEKSRMRQNISFLVKLMLVTS